MNKKDRQLIFDKYDGHCAYCGCKLVKGWHADHIENISRKQKLINGNYYHKDTDEAITEVDLLDENWGELFKWKPYKTVPDGCHKPENDTIENINPSCRSCNHYKSSMDLEMFRKNIGLLVMRLNRNFNQYKIAKRFKLVEETGVKVQFYFETFNSF